MPLQPGLQGDALNVVYLHGFASSAKSTKGTFFTAKFREHGISVHSPDFNEPDFSTLTVTRMVAQVDELIDRLPPGPVVLIGSSLGGFVAVQVAMKRAIDKLVLLAPAIDFSGNRLRDLGDRGLEEWKRTGELNIFHYGYGRIMPVHYDLYTDACRYSCVDAQLSMPIQIFQGRRDTAVNPESVEKWSAMRPNVELHMLDDDHQLTASLNRIWPSIERFIGLSKDR